MFISPRKVHAIGVLTLAWNGVEHALVHLAAAVIKIDMTLAWSLFHDQSGIKLIEKIKEAARLNKVPHQFVDLMDNYLTHYDQCRLNRNVLVHNSGSLGRAGVALKRKTKRYIETQRIKQSVGHIRRAADYIQALGSAISRLALCLDIFNERGNLIADNGSAIPLPAKLHAPEKLWRPILGQSSKQSPWRRSFRVQPRVR